MYSWIRLWQWKVLSFDLTTSSATFERLSLYLNDVIVFAKDFASHVEWLAGECQLFCSARLKLWPEKCHLFQRAVHYLGHLVSQHRVAKIQAVKECTQKVKAFLSFFERHKRFCPDFAIFARPLFEMLNGSPLMIYIGRNCFNR